MSTKTSQLQIRVTAAEKRAIRRRASAAGLDVSAYVLSRALPATGRRFGDLLEALASAGADERPYVLAELNEFLSGMAASELGEAVGHVDPAHWETLSDYESNYVAAMVELACAKVGLAPPDWPSKIPPLDRPRFGTELRSVRPHLLRSSPVPFRRRNIFIDSSIGDRV